MPWILTLLALAALAESGIGAKIFRTGRDALPEGDEWNPDKVGETAEGSDRANEEDPRSVGEEGSEDPWYAEDYKKLVEGYRTSGLDRGWVHPVSFFMYGSKNFPLLVSVIGETSAFAGPLGEGKVIVLGCADYLYRGRGKTLRNNAVKWLTGGKSNPSKAISSKSHDSLIGIGNVVAPSDLTSDVDVYFMHMDINVLDSDLKAVSQFAKEGGSLIVTMDWDTKSQGIAKFVPNSFLSEMGALAIGDIRYGVGRNPALPKILPIWLNLAHVLDHPDKVHDKSFRPPPNLRRFFGRGRPCIESLDTLWKKLNASMDRFNQPDKLSVFSRMIWELAPIYMDRGEQMPKAFNVASFPGEVPPGAEEVTEERVSIDGDYPKQHPEGYVYGSPGTSQWRSTGLYAPAGATITVTFPEDVVKGTSRYESTLLKVRVGGHDDILYRYSLEKLGRSPLISLYYPVQTATVKVANPWGGLIYVLIPKFSQLGEFDVTISGAVRAPYFVLGKTSSHDWETIKNYPAPFAEVEVPKQIVFTIPSKVARSIENITDLSTLWKEALQLTHTLAGFEFPDGLGYRQERFMADKQISTGYMHSRYPIAGYTTSSEYLMNATQIREEGLWGIFHELGHNHQWNGWSTKGMIETVPNLYSLFLNERLFNITFKHEAIKPARTSSRIQKFIEDGKKSSDVKNWLALDYYHILALKFGWESYAALNKVYFHLSPFLNGADRETKMDVWASVYMVVVQKNLCPYFDWWNIALSGGTRDVCSKFPGVEPNLMAKYEKVQQVI